MAASSKQPVLTPGFIELFTPKLVTVLREGYGLRQLRADALAGLTVAVVALPLSMAIAIASGATPAQGLHTAIIGGFLVSLLGGSRFQIGGPAGAFIVLVAATVARHGMDGMILAVLLSGVILLVAGWLRLGGFVRYIPYPVTVGFTAGIAVIIFASQLVDLLGVLLRDEPGELLAKVPALWAVRDSITPAAPGVALVTITLIVVLRRWRPRWPGMLIAVVLAATVAWLLDLPVATIGSRFGGIPATLPLPHLPDLSPARVVALLPAALSFALLGAIESLLSAVVADGMTGRRHRSNCELAAQGVANIGAALFGGICVTGTIARTATNVRAGAHGPVAGILHALFLLGFVLLAAPLAAFVPLAALAGVLSVVAWNMIERHAVLGLLRSGWGEAVVLVTTFLLTVLDDLITGIAAGTALGAVLFIHRMGRLATAEQTLLMPDDLADCVAPRGDYDEGAATDPQVVVYRITGVLFFGAAASIGAVMDRIGDRARVLVVDLAGVPLLDATGAGMIAGLARKMAGRGGELWLTGTSATTRRMLLAHGLRPPLAQYAATVDQARAALAAAAAG